MSKHISIKDKFISSASLSWLQHLVQDPETTQNIPNKTSRQVKSGHYVTVEPTPLPNPKLVAVSPEVCNLIGLPADYCRHSLDFTRYFAGDMSAMSGTEHPGFQSWCTPYALSIFGHELYDNCPFKNGNGYGDGRAVSVGEVLVETEGGDPQRWEMQLKGGGTTPFCRGGDGRSVLRSSVREFLAEEAMHHLGVSTTRALSLVVSGSEQVARPWFTKDSARPRITLSDPRIAHYSLAQRKEILREVNGQPDAMIAESTAIACRVAPSFIRVGHLELFSRRYRAALQRHGPDSSVTSHAFLELRLLAEHMLFRELGGEPPAPPSAAEKAPISGHLQTQLLSALRESSGSIAHLTAEWMRVGFCQGNFNSDNCLVAGRTLDYGPFGFIERYEKNWCMWSGGGEKYSFRSQHLAGERNFFSLATAIMPLLDEAGQDEVKNAIIPAHLPAAEQAVREVYRAKLGLLESTGETVALFDELDAFMEATEADYTMFWRQLSHIPSSVFPGVLVESCLDGASNEQLFAPLVDSFYRALTLEERSRWSALVRRWLGLLIAQSSAGDTGADISGRMCRVNPKYVPREWMLVDAYQAAAQNDTRPLQRLQALFAAPYDEHSAEEESAFYCKMPVDLLDTGGVTTMT